jgi:hypothetical protein
MIRIRLTSDPVTAQQSCTRRDRDPRRGDHVMSIKNTLLATTATLAALGGLAAVETPSTSAATPQCGASCVEVYSRAFGTAEHPNFVETVLDGVARIGQPTTLRPVSSSNPAQDLMPHGGVVSGFYAAGMVSAAVNRHFGPLRAVELEYAPFGVASGLCAGLARTAFEGEGLSLQPCGVSARTVWILDPIDSPVAGFFALVNGSTTSFGHPYSMTFRDDPSTQPLEPIRVRHLHISHRGAVPDTQLWGSNTGVVH